MDKTTRRHASLMQKSAPRALHECEHLFVHRDIRPLLYNNTYLEVEPLVVSIGVDIRVEKKVVLMATNLETRSRHKTERRTVINQSINAHC